MTDRKDFLQTLSSNGATQAEQGVALLWFYNIKQQYDERTIKELSQDFFDEGFSIPNSNRLKKQFKKNKKIIKGRGLNSFKINPKFFNELTEKYSPIISYNNTRTDISSSVIPLSFVQGTKIYIERMVAQINGCYDKGFYDGALVILRRLMESLIIETYINNKQVAKIKNGLIFKSLDGLISIITNDPNVTLSRSAPRSIRLIKDLGDTAAHDRTYITPQEDVDDNMQKIRHVVNELLYLSGIKK